MTLGILTAVSGLANHLANGGAITGLPRSLSMLGRNNWGDLPSAAGMPSSPWCSPGWCCSATALVSIYSIGGSRETSKVAGVPVAIYELLAHVICSMLVGVGALC